MNKVLIMLLSLIAVVSIGFAQEENGVEREAEEDAGEPAGAGDTTGMNARASNFIGTSVLGPEGDPIGEVNDLVITAVGDVKYAIVAFSELETDSRIFVPMQAFDMSAMWEEGILLTRNPVEIDSENPPNLVGDELEAYETGWDRDIIDYWTPYLDTALVEDEIEPGIGENRAFLASRMLEYEIVNFENEGLGELEDIMLDLEQFDVAYVAIATGGFLGIGEELYAVPFEAFTWSGEEENALLSISEEAIEEAEGFSDEWPAEANEELFTDADAEEEVLGGEGVNE